MKLFPAMGISGLRARIGWFLVLGILATVLIFYLNSVSMVFSDGAFFYAVKPWLPWLSPVAFHYALTAIIIISGTLSYFFFKQISQSSFLSLSASIMYVLAPVFTAEFFPASVRFFSLLVVPSAFLLGYTKRCQTNFFIIFAVISLALATFIFPFGGFGLSLLFLVLLLAHKWSKGIFSEKKEMALLIYAGTPLATLLASFMLQDTIISEVWHIQPSNLETVAKYSSVDAAWVLDFPFNALFGQLLGGSSPFSTALSFPAFLLFFIVAGVMYTNRKKVRREHLAPLLWLAPLSVIYLIFSLGPFFKVAGTTFEPLLPLPWLMLFHYDVLGYSPYFLLPLALFAGVGALLFLVRFYGLTQRKGFVQVMTGVLIVFFSQYIFIPPPATQLYIPKQVTQITEKPYSTHVLYTQENSYLESSLAPWQEKTYQQFLLRNTHPLYNDALEIFKSIKLSRSVIKQNASHDYLQPLLYHNIHYVDVYHSRIESFSRALQANSRPQNKLVTQLQSINGIHTIFGDQRHTLFKLDGQRLNEGLLLVGQRGGSPRIEGQKKKGNGNLFKALRVADKGDFIYYNFTDQTQDVTISFHYRNFRELSMSLLLDNEGVYNTTLLPNGKGEITFTVDDVDPGTHRLMFALEKKNGESLARLNTKTTLRINKIRYSIRTAKN